jgi:hypothetical protein
MTDAKGLYPFISKIKIIDNVVNGNIQELILNSLNFCEPIIIDDIIYTLITENTTPTLKKMSLVKLVRQTFHDHIYRVYPVLIGNLPIEFINYVDFFSVKLYNVKNVINLVNERVNLVYLFFTAESDVGRQSYNLRKYVVTQNNQFTINLAGIISEVPPGGARINTFQFENMFNQTFFCIGLYNLESRKLSIEYYNHNAIAKQQNNYNIDIGLDCRINLTMTPLYIYIIVKENNGRILVGACSAANPNLANAVAVTLKSILVNEPDAGTVPCMPKMLSFANNKSLIYGFNNDTKNTIQLNFIDDATTVDQNAYLNPAYYYKINKFEMFNEVLEPEQSNMVVSVTSHPDNEHFFYVAYITGTNQIRLMKLFKKDNAAIGAGVAVDNVLSNSLLFTTSTPGTVTQIKVDTIVSITFKLDGAGDFLTAERQVTEHVTVNGRDSFQINTPLRDGNAIRLTDISFSPYKKEKCLPILMWATRLGVFGDLNFDGQMSITIDNAGCVYVFSRYANNTLSIYKTNEFILDLGHAETNIVAPIETIPNMLTSMETNYSVVDLGNILINLFKDVVIDSINDDGKLMRITFKYINRNELIDAEELALVKNTIIDGFRTLYEDSSIIVLNLNPTNLFVDLGADASRITAFFKTGTKKNPCVLKGTEIVIFKNGKASLIKVEKIQPGDSIVNHEGKYIKVLNHMISTIYTQDHNAPYFIPKNFFGQDRPYSDLYISGDHAILLTYKNNLKKVIYAQDIKILKQCFKNNVVEYHHLLLEDHQENFYLANGLEVESYHPNVVMKRV